MNNLTIQFLMWLEEKPRTYEETMEAWQTSCPRLSIWEDCLHEKFIRVEAKQVILTQKGKDRFNKYFDEDL